MMLETEIIFTFTFTLNGQCYVTSTFKFDQKCSEKWSPSNNLLMNL